MPTPRRITGDVFLGIHRTFVRARRKSFSILAAGAFGEFGAGSVLQPPIQLNGERRMTIGSDVYVGPGSWLQVLDDPNAQDVALVIGDGTSIAGNCVLSAAASLRLGRKVLIARGVYVADHSHSFDDTRVAVLEQGITRVDPVVIEDGAWLGENVYIGPGVRIGKGAVVGANAVVLKDVPDHAIAVGAPARVVRRFASFEDPAA